MPLSAGDRLGPYEILAPIGAGGMGEVWRARDTRLHRDVAIKFSKEQFSERFEREARAVASLNHANICQLYDVGTNYLVMELVEGETLQGPLPLDAALDYARQIAEALEAAHEKGIIHRDLKPANIKITPQGVVKVLDFGLASIAQATAPASGDAANSPTLTISPTVTGTILGTAAYMSPEQARGKPADKRADIWAFGCVFYEMLTGRQLFQGGDVSELLAAVIKDQPDLSALPAELRPVIEKCLRKDARTRWRDIGDVRIALEEAKPEGVLGATPPRVRVLPWVIAGLFALLSAGLAFFYSNAKPPLAEAMRFEIHPPPDHTFGTAFTLSPDGRRIAFTAVAPGGQSELWLRRFDSLEPRLLPGTNGTTSVPFWSPDSRFIVFATGGKLKKIDAEGGPAQTICDAPFSITGGSWSPTGLILFGSYIGPLFKVSEAGGTPTPATVLAPGESIHSLPFFLPDGRHFLYSRNAPESGNTGIYVGSIDTKPEEQPTKRLLIAGYATYARLPDSNQGYVLFLRDTKLMAQPFDADKIQLVGVPVPIADPVGVYVVRGLFSASENGVLTYRVRAAMGSRLTWFDRQGGVLGYVDEPGTGDLALSPDATHAVVRRADRDANNDLWLVDLLRGGSERLTSNPAVEANGVWSPDGRRIVFTSSRDGIYNLYQKNLSGDGKEELLLKSDENKVPYDWSRDGRFLLYVSVSSKTGYDLWILPMTGERKPLPLVGTQFREDQAQFSPDGQWVAYTSDASDTSEVYVRPLTPSEGNREERLISNGGGSQPRWRGDGRELYYFAGRKLMAVDTTTSPAFKVGVPRPLFETTVSIGNTMGVHNWDVTRDGKRFLITVASENNSAPINVVLNWQTALRK